MKIHDYIVVGSGCSGAIAAQTLVDKNVDVVMLDVGILNDKKFSIPNKNFVELRRTDPEQYRYFIGEHAEGVNWGKVGTGAQITPPRKYIMNLVQRFTPVKSANFSSFESLSYGGMGSGWGLQSWEYTRGDMEAAGLNYEKMAKAYSYIAGRIGLSTSRNDATELMTHDFTNYQPAPQMDRNNSYMYTQYLARKKQLNKKGFVIGQTPLSLITKNLGTRKKYSYTGMDFYADPTKSAWRPWITVDELREKPNF